MVGTWNDGVSSFFSCPFAQHKYLYSTVIFVQSIGGFKSQCRFLEDTSIWGMTIFSHARRHPIRVAGRDYTPTFSMPSDVLFPAGQ